MKKQKKILGLVTGLALICCSFTVSAEEIGNETETEAINAVENDTSAQEEDAFVDITVAGVKIVEEGTLTGETVPGVSYDVLTNTLLFNNADIVMDLEDSIYAEEVVGIETSGSTINIELKGENSISYVGADAVERGSCGAMSFSGGTVVFTGDGTLDVVQSFNRQRCGIETFSHLIIESGTINIQAPEIGDFGFTGIAIWGDNFSMQGGELNIDASASKEAGGFYGIAKTTLYDLGPIEISGGAINIKGPQGRKTDAGYTTMNLGIDSQCGDINISNARIYMDMGTAGSTFALASGNEIGYVGSGNLSGGKITIENSYIECKTNGQRREYSSYFQDIVGKENLHFYVGEHAAVKEVPFEEAFKYTDEHMGSYSRYEGQYRCFTISTEEVEIKVTAGDINGDGNVNLVDLMMCLNHVSGEETLTDSAFIAADINGDGEVNLTDLMRLLNFLSGESGEL